jgi:predicted transcriptional regulator YheO
MNDFLEKYIIIGEFISKIMGDNCEVLIHDIKNPKNSVIWIDKGYMSGREPGDSLTDLSIEILNRKEYLSKNYIVNYEGIGNNNKKFVSSTFFIKDDKNELQGFLCVNNDITDYLEFKNQFKKMENFFGRTTEEYKESISTPVSSLAENIIEDIINNHNIPVGRMTKKEKIEIVKILTDRGVFDIKGGTSEAAKKLKVSETTLYRYLKQIDK